MIFNDLYLKKKAMYWALNFAWKLSSFIIKLCEKNSSVNLRFKIFVVAFWARKLFGTFEKWATGLLLVCFTTFESCLTVKCFFST